MSQVADVSTQSSYLGWTWNFVQTLSWGLTVCVQNFTLISLKLTSYVTFCDDVILCLWRMHLLWLDGNEEKPNLCTPQAHNYVIAKRQVRRQFCRYQREITHTYRKLPWDYVDEFSSWCNVRRLRYSVRNPRHRFGVGTLRFSPYVESDPTGVSIARRVWIELNNHV